MAITTTHDPNANRTRWGGILLASGVLLVLMGAAIADINIPPAKGDMTSQQRAQRLVDNSKDFQITGWILLYGALLIAIGAFFLVTRTLVGPSGFPASAFWLFVGIAFTLLLLSVSFRIGGLGPIASAYSTNPALYDAFIAGTFRTLGTIITVAAVIGFVGVFYGESRADNAVIPSWLAYAGLAATALRLVNLSMSYAGNADVVDTGRILGYFTFYISYAVVLVMAIPLAMPNVKLATLTARTTHED